MTEALEVSFPIAYACVRTNLTGREAGWVLDDDMKMAVLTESLGETVDGEDRRYMIDVGRLQILDFRDEDKVLGFAPRWEWSPSELTANAEFVRVLASCQALSQMEYTAKVKGGHEKADQISYLMYSRHAVGLEQRLAACAVEKGIARCFARAEQCVCMVNGLWCTMMSRRAIESHHGMVVGGEVVAQALVGSLQTLATHSCAD